MVRRVVFAVPGDLTIPTGGYAYDRRMIEELRALGWQAEAIDLGEGFPFPSADARRAARSRLAALPADAPIVVDGLALGALPDLATQLGATHRLIALVHHPLALETGLARDAADALRESEARALAHVRCAVTTSAFTARLIISDYGVPAERVRIVRPGNDRRPRARTAGETPLSLLSVGAVVRRKAYDVQAAALGRLLDLRWRLTIAGDLRRDSDAAARLVADVARYELAERVTIAGAVPASRLLALYASADIFVLASRFEGYGMAIAEAIAHGVPVVATAAGAIPETAPASAALLAPPGDIEAFAVALRRMIENSSERQRLAEGAWAAATALPSWERSAKLFSAAIEGLA